MILQLVEVSAYDGPNLWFDGSVVRVTVECAARAATNSDLHAVVRTQLEQLRANLDLSRTTPLSLLPIPGCPDPPQLLGWMTIELMRLAGDDVAFYTVRQLASPRQSELVIECLHAQTATLALRLALQQMDRAAKVEVHHAPNLESGLIDRLIPVAASRRPAPVPACILAAARVRGIPITQIDARSGITDLGHGIHRRRISFSLTSNTSALGDKIAANKHLTLHVLETCGLPVLQSLVARDAERAVLHAHTLGWPVVVKPIDSGDSAGLFLDLRDDDDVRIAFAGAAAESPSSTVVVQRYLTGGDYRILVIDGRIVSAVERRAARVTGDGRHSIRELVEMENRDPRRGTLKADRLKTIPIDETTLHLLERQGLSLDDVPADGRTVRLRQIDDLDNGSEVAEITDTIHPDNAKIILSAARALDLDIAGIDVLADDISKSIWETWGGILEVNSSTGFSSHQFPTSGRAIDPGPAVVDMLFPPGSPVRVPLVAVTGSLETAKITRLIGRMLAAAGHATGIASVDGLFLGGTRLSTFEGNGRGNKRRILLNSMVEMAVLECPPAEIVAEGLAFERCDVAVVTSLSGASPQGLPAAESVICRTVTPDGMLVIPGDDPEVIALARSYGRSMVLYGMGEPAETMGHHREAGGAIVQLREIDGRVTLAIDWGLNRGFTLELSEDIATYSMAWLAAVAAVLALGAPPEHLQLDRMASFS